MFRIALRPRRSWSTIAEMNEIFREPDGRPVPHFQGLAQISLVALLEEEQEEEEEEEEEEECTCNWMADQVTSVQHTDKKNKNCKIENKAKTDEPIKSENGHKIREISPKKALIFKKSNLPLLGHTALLPVPQNCGTLPLSLRDPTLTLTSFCSRLKTHLFSMAYGRALAVRPRAL